jgi:hypothetical protein
MKAIKKELETMYKELIRVIFDSTPSSGASSNESIPKDNIIPLERRINTLIMRIND